MSASRDDGKKFAKEYDRSVAGGEGGRGENTRGINERSMYVTTGKVMRLGSYTAATTARRRRGREAGGGRGGREGRRRRQRDAKESGEKSFIIAQLWNEEVSYETTPREY